MRNMFIGLLIASSLIGSAACLTWHKNPTHQYKVYVDPAFSNGQAEAIIGAAYDWQNATDGFIRFSIATEESGSDVISVIADTSTQMKQEFGPDIAGITFYEGEPSNIYLPINGKSDTDLGWIALHEFGHAIGDVNHLGLGNVMCASTGCSSRTIQCGDVEELCDNWREFACEASKMPPCLGQ